jgi:hypothetical protein
MITRRDFIKGMGALTLIPFIPEMVRPPKVYGESPAQTALRYVRLSVETVSYGDPASVTIQKSMDGIKWDNTGTMTIPTKEGRYKVRYTVHPDGTDAEIVEEE